MSGPPLRRLLALLAASALLASSAQGLEFGGTVVRDSGPEGRFVAKKSSRPAACVTPPAPCP